MLDFDDKIDASCFSAVVVIGPLGHYTVTTSATEINGDHYSHSFLLDTKNVSC